MSFNTLLLVLTMLAMLSTILLYKNWLKYRWLILLGVCIFFIIGTIIFMVISQKETKQFTAQFEGNTVVFINEKDEMQSIPFRRLSQIVSTNEANNYIEVEYSRLWLFEEKEYTLFLSNP